jgi:hypothetical protein
MKKIFLSAFVFLCFTLASQAQSWEAHLTKLNSAIKCSPGLFGLDGAQWAGHAKLKLPADEVKYIISGFAKSGPLFASGPKLNGVKYMTTRADDNVIILKHGTDGVVCKKTQKTVIICKFSENDVTPAQAHIATLKFADHLKTLGY